MITAILMAAAFLLTGCSRSRQQTEDPVVSGQDPAQTISSFKTGVSEPYSVKTELKECSTLDQSSGIGLYVRYTRLVPAEDAPESFRLIIEDCNRRAEEAASARLAAAGSGSLTASAASKKGEKNRFEAYSYIVTVTRADHAAVSILETEYKAGLWDDRTGLPVSYVFRGTTYGADGSIVELEDLTDGEDITGMLTQALETQYGICPASVQPPDYAWTADALGLRFYFSSGALDEDMLAEAGLRNDRAITAAIPYTQLSGEAAALLAEVPQAYIARMDREVLYDLPHGDLSVMLTETDGATYILMHADGQEEKSLSIEYADKSSDFYIIRSGGGFYLFRERMGYQEGFFYDFSDPDGGYGRFAYDTCQYFDSFLREIELALPYDPSCVHMSEVRRSFGERNYADASFIPNGHYSFPGDGPRYKQFVLIDDALQIDTQNTACRVLKDISARELDDQGGEVADLVIEAGSALVLQTVSGEADRYQIPPQRGKNGRDFVYEGCLSDGRRVRFISGTESSVSIGGEFLNRFAQPVSLAEAGIKAEDAAPETFTVHIGGKDYPVIADYSKPGHTGEEIAFGTDIWWQAEGYSGLYLITEQDREDMIQDVLMTEQGVKDLNAELLIGEDGQIQFTYMDRVYTGSLPLKRFYGEYVRVYLSSAEESRSFEIRLRNKRIHEEPDAIDFMSEGLPATNMPSTQPPMGVYLTKQ